MILLFCVFLIGVATSAPVDHPDRVINLPGAPIEPHVSIYSGFLHVSDNETQHNIFYVLCESIRSNPHESPLIVWLNGGPGASSLIGLLLEHGPFLIDASTGQLKYNDFSWNQYANVLYIESPTGVGFSYSESNTTEYNNDDATARLNRKALEEFMTRIHPSYVNRDFYLAGESYAGAYIPHLTREILNHTAKGEFSNANFKGIALGNAAVDDFSNVASAALQMYTLGLIPERPANRSFSSDFRQSEGLFKQWKLILDGMHNFPDVQTYDAFNTALDKLGDAAPYDFPIQCNEEEDATLWHISKPVPNIECQWRNLTESYFNRVDVQKALHAVTDQRQTVNWNATNRVLFTVFYQDNDTVPVYKDIVALAPDNFRILFYTGDMDLICPPLQVALAARRIAEENGMEMRMGEDAPTEWRYLGNLGGGRISYGSKRGISMDVLTVRGASHFVPISHPDRAFQLINNFLTAQPGEEVDYSKMIPRR